MLKAGIEAVQQWVAPGAMSEPDVVIYATWISVWGRWFIWLVAVFLTVYRPGFWYPEDLEYLALPVLLLAVNGLVHYRLLSNRAITQRWLLFLSVMDVALITYGVVIGGGFPSFIFLAYYPALGIFAVVYLVALAQSRLDNGGRPRLRPRVCGGGLRTRHRGGPGEGAGGAARGDVHHGPGHRPDYTVRTPPLADRGDQ